MADTTFRGEHQNKVDAKGRVSIPVDFRRVLEAGDPDWTPGQAPNLVVVYGGKSQQYLECYTLESMAEVDRKIKAMPRGTKRRKAMEFLFNIKALRTNVDENGRLTLPARLREKIDLDGLATFIGTGETFQIWKPETFVGEFEDEIEDWLDDLPADIDPTSLLDTELEL